MKSLNLEEFLERLKKWEEDHLPDDHGSTILGARDKKPRFPERGEEPNERD